ncbi:MAG: histone deacetylase [Caldilineae bacterium]|nr:MAG: histone deacetylase [Caldilineae bacterium]
MWPAGLSPAMPCAIIIAMTTCYAYDPVEQRHTLAGHPEHKGRLASTLRLLREDGIFARLQAIEVTPISPERLQRVHPDGYVRRVEAMARSGGGHLDPDTYVATGSYEAALASAGALINLVEKVVAEKGVNGMSLMRPPGHHALPTRGMGFCLFANVALAAYTARAEFGVERILIVDWDVHHGNGTEAICAEDPTIAFFSTHQYPFYPGTGALHDRGRGAGLGSVVNVPFPAGVGDSGYALAFEKVLVPFARRFRPDLILVSAGYDAHWRDPLAMEQLSLEGYAALARRVRALADELCEGRLVVALEGGYDLDVLPHAVLNTLRILEDPAAPISDPFGPSPMPERDVSALIDEIRALHGLN